MDARPADEVAQPAQAPAQADVCVLGAGPAGLALAHALAARGLEVVCAAPDAGRTWTPRYSLWADDAARLGLAPLLARTWPATCVRAEGTVLPLGRAYAQLDNARAQAELAGGVRLVRATAGPIAVGRDDVRVDLDGATLRARAVVDATGARGGRAAQTAYGVAVDGAALDGAGLDDAAGRVADGAALLMAFDGGPTFLYALPLEGGRVFVEETSLAAAPPVPVDACARRLATRLGLPAAPLPADAREDAGEERCFIPLDAPLARRDGIARFGAAAGFVHPCTGYSVTTSFSFAPRVADAVAATLRLGPRAVQGAVDAIVDAPDRRRVRGLHAIGLELLLSLDGPGLSRFFAAVFSAPPAVWRTFLDGDPAPDALLEAMSALFSSLDRPARRALSRLVLLRHPRFVPALARAVLAGGPRRAARTKGAA